MAAANLPTSAEAIEAVRPGRGRVMRGGSAYLRHKGKGECLFLKIVARAAYLDDSRVQGDEGIK